MEAAAVSSHGESAGELLLRAAALVPWTRYALAALALAAAILYRFLELHLLGDLLRGLRGGRVALTFHPESQVYQRVASKCRSLHGRWEYGIIPRGCRCAGSCLYRRKLLMIFPMLPKKNLVAQVPGYAVAGESSSADVVPEHLRQTAFVHLSEVGVNQSHKLIITIKNLELRSSCCCAFVVSLQ